MALTPSTPTRLTRPVDEARYLVADHAVGRYRVIMRYFFEQHERSRFWLNADEVLEHVRRSYLPSYTAEECDRDLAQLVDWGDLIAEQERSRARSIDEFIRKRLRYQPTRYAIELERLLVRLENQQGSGGSLDPSYLESLWDRLTRLDALLGGRGGAGPDPGHPGSANGSIPAAAGPGRSAAGATVGAAPVNGHVPAPISMGDGRAEEPDATVVRTLWREAYEYFTRTRDFGNDYLARLSAAKPKDLNEFEAFISYKDVLIEYLRRFVQSLIEYTDRVAALLGRWREGGVPERIVYLAAAADAREPDPSTGRLPDPEQCRERRREEFVSLENWFCGRGGVDVLQRATTDAIEVIVRQTQRLIEHRRSGSGLRRDLEALATAFAGCRDLDEAHRLAAVAFGALGTRHVQAEQPRPVPVDRDVWREADPVPVELVPVARGRRERARSEAVADRRAEQEAVLLNERLRQQEEAALWDAIFDGPFLDLADVRLERPELRERLLAVLAQCFHAEDRCAVASDGSRIELVAVIPGQMGQLVAPDGTVHLGRYRLVRHKGRTLGGLGR